MEAIDWKWDINQYTEQPHELFHAVMKVLVAGRKTKKQHENKKKQAPENG